MIHVLLADDQTLVRQGIRSLLGLTPDIRVAAEAADGDEALALIASTALNVLLLDVRMPKRTGLEVLEALRGKPSAPPAILLTTFDDDGVAAAGIRLGARGFLLKDIGLEQLAEAIRVVAGGGTLINPAVTERVLRGLDRIKPDFPVIDAPVALTARETEVLRWMAAGKSNREIADMLGTAEGTIKNHASSIFGKLGVRDRTRAVLRAIELGYI
ncbi:response regulator [Polyangium aurulentum]|uniref:response regulator n=1 Tax=Polyangium aurulentum TaxID=2567896 RepID=UPI0010AE8A96|nr:response regulator transcription factor [Polyangium aurulentum]UQA60855.1 response regulator transcription factor [Polyangium aurulentum]